MKKLAIFLQIVLMFHSAFSQEVCAPKETLENTNDISSIAKCTVVSHTSSEGTKEKSKVTVVSSRNHQKRRALNEVQPASELFSANINHLKINDSIEQLKITHIKQRITAINTALEEKNSLEQVPFNSVEEIPKFRNCSDESLDEVDCFNYEMQEHLMQNIIYPEKAVQKRIEGDIWVSFIITSSGNVKNIVATGPESSDCLKQEAIRVISLLPSFIPGKQNNQDVNVTYTFPISFSLNTTD